MAESSSGGSGGGGAIGAQLFTRLIEELVHVADAEKELTEAFVANAQIMRAHAEIMVRCAQVSDAPEADHRGTFKEMESFLDVINGFLE